MWNSNLKSKLTPLQSLMWPTKSISTERDLYVHCEGPVGYAAGSNILHFAAGGVARMDTYFNLFNIGKWSEHADLANIQLTIKAKGTFALSVVLIIKGRSGECVLSDVVKLSGKEESVFDLSHCTEFEGAGILFFELRALGTAEFWDATWQTNQAALRSPKLALSITTFKREDIVQKTVARFERFMEESAYKDNLHLFVVDNGQSAELQKSKHVTPILNENLGGSGGFARGLIEAQSAGFTHCLFMDDDASVHMESLERTWTFLAYATDPNTAVSGALMQAADRGVLWENGSIFNGACHAQYRGSNLRDAGITTRMEMETIEKRPNNFYGAWWYFAFPLAGVKHYPFPFFVRGDDINFSLVHDFNIVTLNGVISFQDVDFIDKETPQVLYLDMRSFLANSLSVPAAGHGRSHVINLAMRFMAHPFLRCHYETVSARNLGMEDALRGPGFFAENADMSERRAFIKANIDVEIWKPITGDLPKIRHHINPHNRFVRFFLSITVNGLFIPFFSKIGNNIIVNIQDRHNLRICWGASMITYVNEDRTQYYTVTHDKAKGFKEALRFLKNVFHLYRNYLTITSEWQSGYDALTSTNTFWTDRFKMGSDAPKKNK